MRRVVVTGMGIISSLGNDVAAVTESLRGGRSGLVHNPEYAELGFRSHVSGHISVDLESLIDRKQRRFMGEAAAYTYLAMREAIAAAALPPELVSNDRSGLIAGSGGTSTSNIVECADITRNRGVRKVGPYMVPRTMGSTVSACVGTAYGIRGLSYSITSACSTSGHCIGNGSELIQLGKQDIVFAGGGEELHWTQSVMFDAMGALSSKYNDRPQTASRPYDADRDGFVISGGGGILVLEELEHARRRGAPILAELVGYGASADGADMVQPSGEGAVRCMRLALEGVREPVDYVNTHGTSTPAGDIKELQAIGEVFGDRLPALSSTKSLTGHALGAAGVHEAIYSLIMLREDFVAASANIEQLDPEAAGFPIARQRIDRAGLRTVMSNNFGFGGTNACLVFSRFDD